MVAYKNMLAALASVLSLATPIIAEETNKGPKVTVGYTALETGLNRLLTNCDIGNRLTIGHHGLDESPGFKHDRYYGRHVFDAGIGSELKPSALLVTGPDGFSYTGFGVRYDSLPKKLSYGFVECFVSPSGVADFAVFYGMPIGSRASVELYQETMLKDNTKPSNHTEAQGNLSLGETYSVFGRMEWTNLKDRKFLAGISFKLGG